MLPVYYIYIIQSQSDNSYYKGFTENPIERLRFHNAGLSTYTAKKIPWQMVALFAFGNKTDALIKERKLKKYGHESLVALINSNRNILDNYLSGFYNN